MHFDYHRNFVGSQQQRNANQNFHGNYSNDFLQARFGAFGGNPSNFQANSTRFQEEYQKKPKNKANEPPRRMNYPEPPKWEVEGPKAASLSEFHKFCIGPVRRDYTFDDIFDTYVRNEDGVTYYSCKLCKMSNFTAQGLRGHVTVKKGHLVQVKMLNDSIKGRTPAERKKCAQGRQKIFGIFLNFLKNFEF